MEAKLTSLKALWDAKRQKRPMPSRDDFGIHELKPWLGHLALVDVTGERIFRLCGTSLFSRFGGDMTGQPVARVSAALRRGVTDQVAKACETKTPVPVECCIQAYGQPVIYSELVLPLSQNGEEVSMLLWASYPTPQHVVHAFS
ncbi:MAG TPA: PAS domain-containing protein [Rhizomicrobium sp.]